MARGRDMILEIRATDDGSRVVRGFADEVEDQTKKLNKQYASIGKQVDKTARQAKIAFGVMLAGAAAATTFALRAAVDFESSFASVRKTVDATEQEFAALSQGIRDMAKEVPIGVDQLNEMAAVAGQLGVEKEHILDYTRVVAEMGVASDLAGEQAAFALARISEAAGVPQENVRNLGSAIVELGNNAAATESEIVDVTLGLAGIGKVGGVSIQTILGISASIKEMGLESQASATAVQRVVTGMIGAVQSGGEELENFARIAGTSTSEFATMFREDADAALMTFLEGINRMGQEAVPALDEVGLGSQRTLRALLALGGGFDTVREQVDRATRGFAENTALADEAERRFDTMSSKLQILRNHLRDAGIEAGFSIVQNEKLNESLGRLASQLKDTGLDLTTFAGALGTIGAELLTALVNAVERANRKIMEFMANFGIESPGAFLQVLTALISTLNKLPGGTNPATSAMEDLLRVVQDSKIETEEHQEVLRKYATPFSLVLARHRALNPELDEYSDNQRDAAGATSNTTRTVREQVSAWRENLDALNRYREQALVDTKREVEEFTDRMGVFTDFVTDARIPVEALGGPAGMAGLVAPTDSAREAFERFQSKSSGLNRILGGVKDSLISIGEGMGFLSRTEGGVEFDLAGGFKNLGKGMIDQLGSMAISGISSAISAGLNAIIGLVADAFGSDAQDFASKFKTELEGIGAVSDGLAEQMGEMANALKDQGRELPFVVAKWAHLDEAIAETGVSGDNFTAVMAQVNEGMAHLEHGTITEAEAVETLEGVIQPLIDSLGEMDEAGRVAFRQMIEDARAAGLEIEALDQHIRSAASGVGQGVQTMLDAGIRGAGQAEFAATAVVTAFQELVAQGVGASEAFDMLGPQMSELQAQADEMGVTLPAPFQELSEVMRVMADEQIAKVQRGIDGMGQTMRSLLEMGIKPTAQQFNVFQNNAVAGFQQLIDQGLTSQQAFMAMSDDFKLLARLQNEFGMEVSDATKEIFEQAGATDLLESEGVSTADVMREGFEGLFDRFDALLAEFGVTVDDTFGDTATTVSDHLADIEFAGKDHFTALGDHAAGAAHEALREWELVHQQMVGNSIIPDIQAQAAIEFQKIGESAQDAARVTTRGFEDTSRPFMSLPHVPSGRGGSRSGRAELKLTVSDRFDDSELGRFLWKLIEDKAIEAELVRPGE